MYFYYMVYYLDIGDDSFITSAGGVKEPLSCHLYTTHRSMLCGGVYWEEKKKRQLGKQMSSFQRENDAAKSLFRRLEVFLNVKE